MQKFHQVSSGRDLPQLASLAQSKNAQQSVQAESTPAHQRLTQTVGQPRAKSALIGKGRFGVESGKGKSVFSGGAFPSQSLSLCFASRFSRS